MTVLFRVILVQLACFMFLFLSTHSAHAVEPDHFPVGFTISDGKEGRVWKQWRQNIQTQAVSTIQATLRRTKGTPSTYVTLRFGTDPVLENGRRVTLENDEPQTITWDADGAVAHGKPLVLNAYEGEVEIESVTVQYGKPSTLVSSIIGTQKSSAASQPVHSASTERCLSQRRLKPPKIEILLIENGGDPSSDTFQIEGEITGSCVKEAAHFEHGRLKTPINFPLSSEPSAQAFQLRVASGRNGEIRVTTICGDEDILFIDDAIAKERAKNR